MARSLNHQGRRSSRSGMYGSEFPSRQLNESWIPAPLRQRVQHDGQYDSVAGRRDSYENKQRAFQQLMPPPPPALGKRKRPSDDGGSYDAHHNRRDRGDAPQGPHPRRPSRMSGVDEHRQYGGMPTPRSSHRDSSTHQQHALDSPAGHPGETVEPSEEELLDPMDEVDVQQGRFPERARMGGRPIEYRRRGYEVKVTPGAQILYDYVRHFSRNAIRPKDVDAAVFLALRNRPDQLNKLAEANNVVAAWTNSGMYASRYSSPIYHGRQPRIEKLKQVGCVWSGPVPTIQGDRNISIKDLNRIHSMHAKMLAKKRHGVILAVKNGRALVLTTTSFQGRQKPKEGKEKEYLQLVHVNKMGEAPKDEGGNVTAIRYSGFNGLPLTSFLHLEHLEYIDISAAPAAAEGMLEAEDFQNLADALRLPEQHQLRVSGRQMMEAKEKQVLACLPPQQTQQSGGGTTMEDAGYKTVEGDVLHDADLASKD